METPLKVLTNKPLPTDTEKSLASCLEEGEKLLFAVVCDLSVKGNYETNVIAVSDRRVICPSENGTLSSLNFEDIESAAVKRMYGNARLMITLKNGDSIQAIRFTYAVAALCDMTAVFITNVAAGSPTQEEMPAAEAAFEKRSLCVPNADAL